jgi:hypothetical protein
MRWWFRNDIEFSDVLEKIYAPEPSAPTSTEQQSPP